MFCLLRKFHSLIRHHRNWWYPWPKTFEHFIIIIIFLLKCPLNIKSNKFDIKINNCCLQYIDINWRQVNKCTEHTIFLTKDHIYIDKVERKLNLYKRHTYTVTHTYIVQTIPDGMGTGDRRDESEMITTEVVRSENKLTESNWLLYVSASTQFVALFNCENIMHCTLSIELQWHQTRGISNKYNNLFHFKHRLLHLLLLLLLFMHFIKLKSEGFHSSFC